MSARQQLLRVVGVGRRRGTLASGRLCRRPARRTAQAPLLVLPRCLCPGPAWRRRRTHCHALAWPATPAPPAPPPHSPPPSHKLTPPQQRKGCQALCQWLRSYPYHPDQDNACVGDASAGPPCHCPCLCTGAASASCHPGSAHQPLCPGQARRPAAARDAQPRLSAAAPGACPFEQPPCRATAQLLHGTAARGAPGPRRSACPRPPGLAHAGGEERRPCTLGDAQRGWPPWPAPRPCSRPGHYRALTTHHASAAAQRAGPACCACPVLSVWCVVNPCAARRRRRSSSWRPRSRQRQRRRQGPARIGSCAPPLLQTPPWPCQALRQPCLVSLGCGDGRCRLH